MKAAAGRLLDHKNAPVKGVCIGLFSEHSDDSPRLVKSVETDEDGYFRMENVNTGRYRLVARAPGFFVVDIPVTIVGKHNLMVSRRNITIKLELARI
jgi:5-hydroxyisourate hydrolase-like protein (transthyretin family)